MRTRRRWFAGLRKPYAWRASSLASLFRLSEVAFVTPVRTAQVIWSFQRAIVLARLISSGMSSCLSLRLGCARFARVAYVGDVAEFPAAAHPLPRSRAAAGNACTAAHQAHRHGPQAVDANQDGADLAGRCR